jgi:tetratricopeptide (TPR) repeat protein
MNRGVACGEAGDGVGAIEDHGQAIALWTDLQARLQSSGQWPPAWQNALATAYMNRGVDRRGAGDGTGAIEDYGQAIALMADLQARLQSSGQWPPAWQNDLARAYLNRGNARRDVGDGAGAIEDYGQAIALRTDLQERLQSSGQWPPAWQNDLAKAYGNRGNARRDAGDGAGAIEDHGQAIAMMADLQGRLQSSGQWPPAWQNNLAQAYMNRGNARGDAGNRAGAIEDYGQAIALRTDLQERLQSSGQWPPAWQNDLATAYINRGNARRDVGDGAGAIEDHGQAIALRTDLQTRLQSSGQRLPAWQNNLASAYMNRGVARSAAGDGTGAIEDYGQAIALRTDLQERLQSSGQWPPAWQNNLAEALMILGLALDTGPEPAEALVPYTRAIALWSELVQTGQLFVLEIFLDALSIQMALGRRLARWSVVVESLTLGLTVLRPILEQGVPPRFQQAVGRFLGSIRSIEAQERTHVLAAASDQADRIADLFARVPPEGGDTP